MIITGSFLDGDTYASFNRFRSRLPSDVDVYLVHLKASKSVRDRRRIDRDKPSNAALRNHVDASYSHDDSSLRDNAVSYRYIAIDNSDQRLAETIREIMSAVPEIYSSAEGLPNQAEANRNGVGG